jgi:hypothetical protein
MTDGSRFGNAAWIYSRLGYTRRGASATRIQGCLVEPTDLSPVASAQLKVFRATEGNEVSIADL